MSEELITIREAAKRLKVSEATVRRYFDQGLIQGHRTPAGTRRIYLSSVAKLERAQLPGITFET